MNYSKDTTRVRRSKRNAGRILLAILLMPLWMWVAWLLTPKKRLVVAIIDKTVTTRQVQEHISLDWVLRHEKYTKTKGALYQPDRDYFGFFPGKEDQFTLKGLERFPGSKLQELSADADLAYFTDTYGVYSNEWYSKRLLTERSSLVYGGMTMQDIELLRDMKSRHKLMIAEFNAIGSPTAAPVRGAFEEMFGMHWTGWTGRYFSDLDTSRNKELPHWLIHNFIAQHDGKWPFHKSGIAFVSNSDQVTILEEGAMLEDPVPYIETTDKAAAQLHVPKEIKYPFWFDVIDAGRGARGDADGGAVVGRDTGELATARRDSGRGAGSMAGDGGPGLNEVPAEFVLRANAAGKAELARYGIPSRFPAVLRHRGADYGFYYFSGDFCDNPIGTFSSYFKAISFFSPLLYDNGDPAQRAGFFWNFYRPMMTRILGDYYDGLPKR